MFILRNLSTLTESGVSLPKALGTLAEEKALEKHRDMLHAIRRQLENGETLQLGARPVRVDVRYRHGQPDQGWRALRHAGRNARQRSPAIAKKGIELRSEIIRKLAYPMMLVVMGTAVITFLLTYVIPVFKKTYDEAHVPLPFITQAADRGRRSSRKAMA